uniref:Reverse transcriptase domain-containing protein n=1 Tax=Tanacetum cinerariifolium TaxID=118510 RepID=A0A699HTZ3_TANCI|nr:reverse transcriptase domain-containing protein [Tanacetum cinerariifolium]
MLRACTRHGFSELTQIYTFYSGLNEQDQDSLNAAAGGDLLRKVQVRLMIELISLQMIVNKQVITLATAKAVEKTCVICGGAHAYYDCIATDSNQSSVCAATSTYNQVSPPNRASNQITPPGFAPGFQNQPFQAPNNHVQLEIPNELSSYMKSNESLIRNMQNQINVLRGDFNKQEENLRRNLNNDMRSILGSFFQNQASTSGTLLSNNVPNPKGEMKAVTTRSGLAYEGPLIPTNSSLEKVVEREIKVTTDKEHSNYQGSTAHIQPSVVPTPIPEPGVLKTQPKPNIPYPSRLNDQKLHEKATNQMEKFFQIFHDLHFDISFANALLLMSKFASIIKSLLTNKDKLFELAKWIDPLLVPKELPKTFLSGKFNFPTDFVVVDFEADPRVPLIPGRSFLRTGRALIDVYEEEITIQVNDESVTFNLNQTMRYSSTFSFSEETKSEFCKEPIVKSSSPTLTPFGESDFLLEEIEDFLKDESIPMGIEDSFYDPEGDILYLEKLLNDDPSQLLPMDPKQAKETKEKSSIEEPPELELKELSSH